MQGLRRRGGSLRSAARLQKIVRVFAKYGFQHFIQRLRLGRFIPEKFISLSFEDYTRAERLRMAFEHLGPAFVKLGQLLSSRPDLVPKDVAEELEKLRDRVSIVPFSEIRLILNEHFSKDISEVFESIDEEPIGAASMAQVYQATLRGGTSVVIKVQRPGAWGVLQEDIEVLYTLARLLKRYVPESRVYDPEGVISEFSRLVELEVNFVVEANNIHRFQVNFQDIPWVQIPEVYKEHSGERVLVMEKLEGISLSDGEALEKQGVDREKVLERVIRLYLQMVFKEGLYHGDLHTGNLFWLSDERLGLIDFGVVGRLSQKTQSAIINMFFALADENYEWLASEYIDLAPYTDQVDVDPLARGLRDLMAPYYGLASRHMDVGKVLVDSTSLAAKYQLKLPPELILFFRSIIAVESIGRMMSDDFDLVSRSLGFVSEVARSRYTPKRVMRGMGAMVHDSSNLLLSLPRQVKQLLRRMNSPEFSFEVEIHSLRDIRRAIEVSSNILFLGLIIGSLILSASLIAVFDKGPWLFEGLSLPLFSAIGYGLAGALSLVAFVNYIRK